MVDREKVIKGLECCVGYGIEDTPGCEDCPYNDMGDTCERIRPLYEDAIALLKTQEPHLLTLDEIHDSMVVYLEAGKKFLKRVDDDGVVLAIGGSSCANAKCFITVYNVSVAAMNDEYNVTWRAWSERPTREQMEGTPWS